MTDMTGPPILRPGVVRPEWLDTFKPSTELVALLEYIDDGMMRLIMASDMASEVSPWWFRGRIGYFLKWKVWHRLTHKRSWLPRRWFK